MSKFNEWYDNNFNRYDFTQSNFYTHSRKGAEAAWDEQQSLLDNAIARLENYPCDMSCYVTQDELNSAKRMKESMIRILKEEMGYG